VAKCYDDVGTSPLSELGKKQAQDLVEKLGKEGVEVIISSPFVRTVQTVTPFAEASGIVIETMTELRETEHGIFANKTHEGEAYHICLERFKKELDYRF
jgi:broad specificity phosphatase PhoE